MTVAPCHSTKLVTVPSPKPAASTPAPSLCTEPATEALWHHNCASPGCQAHTAGPLWPIKEQVRLPIASASESIQHTEPEQAWQARSRQEEAAMPHWELCCMGEKEQTKIYHCTTQIYPRATHRYPLASVCFTCLKSLMISALALLQWWRPLLSSGTANHHVHAVLENVPGKYLLQHILVAPHCESQTTCLLTEGLPVPKWKGEQRRGGETPESLQHSVPGNMISKCNAVWSFHRQGAVPRKSSGLWESSCLAAGGSRQVVGGWRMCWERGSSERIFVLAEML